MIDPFAAGHREKERVARESAEKATDVLEKLRVKAKFDALAKPKPAPAEQPYVPQKAPWDQ